MSQHQTLPPLTGATPVMALFRAWQRLYDLEKQTHEASPTGSDASTRISTEALMVVEAQMIETPATGPEDWMAKMVATTCYGVFPHEDEDHPVWQEARQLLS